MSCISQITFWSVTESKTLSLLPKLPSKDLSAHFCRVISTIYCFWHQIIIKIIYSWIFWRRKISFASKSQSSFFHSSNQNIFIRKSIMLFSVDWTAEKRMKLKLENVDIKSIFILFFLNIIEAAVYGFRLFVFQI